MSSNLCYHLEISKNPQICHCAHADFYHLFTLKKSTIKQRCHLNYTVPILSIKSDPYPLQKWKKRSCYIKRIRPKWPTTWGLWSLKWPTTRVKSCTLCKLGEGGFFYDRHLSVKLNWFTVKTRPMTEKHTMLLKVLHKPTKNKECMPSKSGIGRHWTLYIQFMISTAWLVGCGHTAVKYTLYPIKGSSPTRVLMPRKFTRAPMPSREYTCTSVGYKAGAEKWPTKL